MLTEDIQCLKEEVPFGLHTKYPVNKFCYCLYYTFSKCQKCSSGIKLLILTSIRNCFIFFTFWCSFNSCKIIYSIKYINL